MKLRERIKYKTKSVLKTLNECANRCKMDPTTVDQSKSQSFVEKRKPQSLMKTIVNVGHKFLVLLMRWFFRTIYGEHGHKMQPIRNLILMESASSLALKIRTRKLTSVEVMEAFIDRCKEINPLLNIVVDERFEQALKDAEKADQLIASGTLTVEQLASEKPFLGVPISTKDCIKVKDLLHTAGIWKRRTIRGDKDARAMELMRRSGAIPFALTNVSECCMWWESVNTIHGRSRNPYDNNRIVGGSSGGEGALQAAAGSPFGLGSDIGGSIRMPAFFNGIFGHKPSRHVVSNDGQYPRPINEEQDMFLAIGPMCRYATDLKPMLRIIADGNAKKLRLDEPVDLKQVKFFYQLNDGGGSLVSPVDMDIRDAMEKVMAHFRSTVKADVRKVYFDKLRKSAAMWFANMKHAEETSFDAQLVNLEGKINPYVELFKWLIGKSNHTFVGIMTAITEHGGVQYGTPQYHHMVKQRDELLEEFQAMLGDNGVLIYPTHPTVAPYHNEALIRALNFSYTGVINVLGLPSTSVPLGLGREGLPIGLQVIGNVNQDRLCLAVACELERAFGGWVAPDVLA
ncbi:fatty-acid amide hydrolase 2-B-like [Malaya genurostris]|uniref:fatty-acid amide hydrolase 2-B-like n=1 Tax=Malaya genurostris TaxID=325434 RepID=UPI0026F40719|nr:fatty-acid amide hydrolase 2-B-like [Malaya genurostris]XP_058465334.1 fatty-acid amide hydrolase 2-B-like [Malaya genurostris]XP_058465335.1 fatty-acid amide hydrolase 2-B-like [Malaya genurostris]XP_058465336.1 fatty-acid amide hydrolase 2-B-like [Malaya genurostris]